MKKPTVPNFSEVITDWIDGHFQQRIYFMFNNRYVDENTFRAQILFTEGDSRQSVAKKLREIADQIEAGEGPLTRRGFEVF